MDDAIGVRGKEEKSQLLSQVPTQLEEPEVLKFEVHPVKVKVQGAPPEVLEKSRGLGQCADVQLQRWALVKNTEICDTVIYFQSLSPLYSWDKSSVSQ